MANHDDVLRLTVEPLDDARLIRAAGEIDMSNVAALRRELDAARMEAVTVLLDLSGVTFIDSSGLHVLLRASHSSAGSDWFFFMIRPSESVLRLIELSGTADVLTVVDPTFTPAGKTPTARGESDGIHDVQRRFQRAMADQFRSVVEQATGREVRSSQSESDLSGMDADP